MNRKFFIGSVGEPNKDYTEENRKRCISLQAHVMHKDTFQKGVFEKVNIGDICFLKYNSQLIAFGEVNERVISTDNSLDGWTYLIKVNQWFFYDEKEKKKGVNNYGISNHTLSGAGQMGTIKEIDSDYGLLKMKEISGENNELYIKIIKEFIMDTSVNKIINILEKNKNLILTGAPGTGKTYLAKQIAQQMIFGEIKEYPTVEEQNRFDERCGFVQFHPSYDYTDFVEGLRPVKTDKELGFKRKDGVFKNFCKRAVEGSITTEIIKNQFDLLWKDIQNGKIEHIPLYSGQDSLQMIVDASNYETIHFSKKDNPNVVSEGNDVMLSDIYTIIIKKHINTIDALKDVGPDREKLGVNGNHVNKWAVCNYILEKINHKPYVFIIDEINRGEISKIFGELFYSIDPGYRGEKGKVDTQYQNLIPKEGDNDFVPNEADVFRKGFYVPNNVYIIGTMNDIDRSVESLDFAMRRRFAFKEIKVEDRIIMLDDLQWKEDAVERMKKLNTAIEKIEGLSSAFHIGPAYFLKLKNYNGDFDQLWEYHIEGLLFEYIRGMTDVNVKLKALANAYGYSKANDYDQPSNN